MPGPPAHPAPLSAAPGPEPATDLQASVVARFSAAAERYAASAVHASGPDLARLVEGATLRGDERVLDVGTGAGHTALALAEGAREVVACDLSEAMLEQARRAARERGLGNVRCRHGDAEELPFRDASFDVVSCRMCAHHFARPERAVAEMARVLRPGGRLVLSDSVAPEDPAADTLLNAVELLRDPSHVRDHPVSTWRTWLRAAGLGEELLARLGLELDFDDWFARMGTGEASALAVRRLFAGAPPEVSSQLGFDPARPERWAIPAAVLRGKRPA